MSTDQALAPVGVVLVLGIVFAATAVALSFVLVDDPAGAPVTAGFTVHEDEDPDRLRLQKTGGEVLHTANLDLIVGADGQTARIDASEVPNLGGTWQVGESACVAGQGPDCLQVEGVDTVEEIRVAEEGQLIHTWEGEVDLEEATLTAGSGPVLAVDSGEGDGGGGTPDLRVSSLSANRSPIEEGDAVGFEVAVDNGGEASAPATTVEVTVDGSTVDTVDVPALDPGESATVTAGTWTASGSTPTAVATVDPGSSVDESDASNNDEQTPLVVASEDPGHAYEDTDNDALFTPGTDAEIPNEEIHDGTYHVEDPWSLVIPASVGAIEAGSVNYTAGDDGHVVLDADVDSSDEGIRLEAGAYVRATGVELTTSDERIVLDAGEGPVNATASTLTTEDERVILRSGGDVVAEDAALTADDERVVVDAAGAARLAGASLDAAERVPLTAGGDVDLEDATLTAEEALTVDTASDATVRVDGAHLEDEDDTLDVGPDGAAIEGSPSHGEAAHEPKGGQGPR